MLSNEYKEVHLILRAYHTSAPPKTEKNWNIDAIPMMLFNGTDFHYKYSNNLVRIVSVRDCFNGKC